MPCLAMRRKQDYKHYKVLQIMADVKHLFVRFELWIPSSPLFIASKGDAVVGPRYTASL